MRLWSLHPGYLDLRGLVALWREALLAQAVLRGSTRGYTRHPQLDRFKQYPDPLAAIGAYLNVVAEEARQRGYAFNAAKICCIPANGSISVTRGQIKYEWRHLLGKLRCRSPHVFDLLSSTDSPDPHPLFHIVDGDVEPWEKTAKEG